MRFMAAAWPVLLLEHGRDAAYVAPVGGEPVAVRVLLAERAWRAPVIMGGSGDVERQEADVYVSAESLPEPRRGGKIIIDSATWTITLPPELMAGVIWRCPVERDGITTILPMRTGD